MIYFDLKLLKSYNDPFSVWDTELMYQLYLWSFTMSNLKALGRKYLSWN